MELYGQHRARRVTPFGLRGEDRLISVMDFLDVHVRHIEEPSLLQADADESRLHTWKNLEDSALVDVAYNAQLRVALDIELRHHVLLMKGDAGFVLVGVHDNLHCQLRSSPVRHVTATFSMCNAPIASPSSP